MEQYYAELYLGIPGQEDEQHIGYIESWLIQKPTAQTPDRSNQWVSDWLAVDGDLQHNVATGDCVQVLRTFYTKDGEIQPALAMSNPKIQRDQGVSAVADDLGPQGTEIVYISLIWIDENVRIIQSTCSDSVIFLCPLKCFLQLTVFWQWNSSACPQLVLQVRGTYPVACPRSCLRSPDTTSSDRGVLKI